MSKQHSKVESNYHAYNIGNFFYQDDLTIHLNSRGLDKVLKDKSFRYMTNVLETEVSDVMISKYGDIWFRAKRDGEVIIEGIPFKHSCIYVVGDGYIMILYSSYYDSHKLIIKNIPVGDYRFSYYCSNIYFPLKQESLYCHDVRINRVGEGFSVETSLEYKEKGFYIQDVSNGDIYEEVADSYKPSITEYLICPFVRNTKEFVGKVERADLSITDNVSGYRMHKNAEELHFPYPCSLLSFQMSEVMNPISSSLRRYSIDYGYGDGSIKQVTDKFSYRVHKGDNFTSLFGYAPRIPIPEVLKSYSLTKYNHGEVNIVLSDNGIEMISLLELPFVMYLL